jgi:hypothetical protein
MALQKTFTLPNGAAGNYVKIIAAPADYLSKEISVWFGLYLSAAQAATNPKATLSMADRPFAKLRLSGAKFDQWLSTTALAANPADDPFRAQIYAAAKVEPAICDFQPEAGQLTVFSDAIDV